MLRARASSAGVELLEASDVDLAAAVVGADAWAHLVNASSLQNPAQYGHEAVSVLGAVLSRAAGRPLACEELLTDACATDPHLLSVAMSHARWVRTVVGSQGPEALRRAAEDLACAGPSSVFAAFAELLCLTSDDLEGH